MDFALNEQQEMMQAMARNFLAAEFPEKVLKAAIKDETGLLPELWQKLAATNLTGLAIPEQYGGVGDFLDLIVVLEEMGRVCFTGPFFSTVALGASIIRVAGSEAQKKEYLPPIAEGKLLVTLAVSEESGRYTADSIQARAVRQGADYVISGKKLFVPDANVADYIITAARTEKGITLFIVDIKNIGVRINSLKTISGDRLCEVVFDHVKIPVNGILGEANKGWDYLDVVLQQAAVARCAEMVGLAGQALKLTLDYAKERIAFGHPIGAFQAIQHRCADMLIDIDGARFVTYQAAWRLNEGLPAAREAAIAKAWTGQACRRVMSSAHQVHGAVGFTEDHILHYYTKRARACEFSFGGVDDWLEKLGELA